MIVVMLAAVAMCADDFAQFGEVLANRAYVDSKMGECVSTFLEVCLQQCKDIINDKCQGTTPDVTTPTKEPPTKEPITKEPTKEPTKAPITKEPTKEPTKVPITQEPPTKEPPTEAPPTQQVTTSQPAPKTPTKEPSTAPPTAAPETPTEEPAGNKILYEDNGVTCQPFGGQDLSGLSLLHVVAYLPMGTAEISPLTREKDITIALNFDQLKEAPGNVFVDNGDLWFLKMTYLIDLIKDSCSEISQNFSEYGDFMWASVADYERPTGKVGYAPINTTEGEKAQIVLFLNKGPTVGSVYYEGITYTFKDSCGVEGLKGEDKGFDVGITPLVVMREEFARLNEEQQETTPFDRVRKTLVYGRGIFPGIIKQFVDFEFIYNYKGQFVIRPPEREEEKSLLPRMRLSRVDDPTVKPLVLKSPQCSNWCWLPAFEKIEGGVFALSGKATMGLFKDCHFRDYLPKGHPVKLDFFGKCTKHDINIDEMFQGATGIDELYIPDAMLDIFFIDNGGTKLPSEQAAGVFRGSDIRYFYLGKEIMRHFEKHYNNFGIEAKCTYLGSDNEWQILKCDY